MQQFLRDYTLYISGPKYGVYGNNVTVARTIKPPLRITFNLSKSILLEANTCEITIYNLSPDTEREIIQQGAEVILEGGYQGNTGIIFKGQLFQPIRGKENGTDYYLRLICIDGDAYLNLTWDAETIGPDNTRRQLAEQVIRSSTNQLDSVDVSQLPNESFVDGSIPTNERSKVVFGCPCKYLSNIAKMSNSTFYIENNVGKFFNPNSTQGLQNAHLINKETGMIGQPEQIDRGVSVKCLLNPSIKLGDFIKIDNKTVITKEYEYGTIPYLLDKDGIYRIIKMNAVGDSRGQDWYWNLTTITQAGLTPEMMVGQYGELMV